MKATSLISCTVDGAIETVAFSPDGALLAITDTLQTSMWSVSSGKQLWVRPPGRRARFANRDTLLVSNSGQPALFDAATGDLQEIVPLGATDAVAVQGDGSAPPLLALYAFLEGEARGGVVLWQGGETIAAEGEPLADAVVGFPITAGSLALTSDKKSLVIAERKAHKAALRVVDLASLATVWELPVSATSFALSPDGSQIAAVTAEGQCLLVSLLPGSVPKTQPLPAEEELSAVAWPLQDALVLGLAHGGVKIVDATSGAPRTSFGPAGDYGTARVTGIDVAKAGRLVVAAAGDRAFLWSLAP